MTLDPTTLRLRFLAVLGVLPLAACGKRFESESCLPVDESVAECPSEEEASEELVGEEDCGFITLSVEGPGERVAGDTGAMGEACCYPVTKVTTEDACIGGRPYYDEGQLVFAEAVRAGGWAGGKRPDVARLSAEERRVLAAAWTHDALIEHASVAAFAKFALELLAVGAPAELVDAAHVAARDEVRHARLAFALAEAYAGEAVAPGPFPFGGSVPVGTDLAALAAATAREGCVGETVVALLAAEALRDAEDPAVREVLAVVAADEARHAEIAWRAVRWMVEAGGEPVRAAVAAVFEDVAARGVAPPEVTFGASEDVLARHGRIRPEAVRAMVARAIEEVVLPVGRAVARAA